MPAITALQLTLGELEIITERVSGLSCWVYPCVSTKAQALHGMGVGCSEFGVPSQNQAELSVRGGCEVRPLWLLPIPRQPPPCSTVSAPPPAPSNVPAPHSFQKTFLLSVNVLFLNYIDFFLLKLTPFLTIRFRPYSSISFPSKLHICTLSHTPHPLSALGAACVCMGRAIYGIMGNLSAAASLEKPPCFLFAVISCR